MTKLDALRKVLNAYKHVISEHGELCLAAVILEEKFHQVRRSMQSIKDVIPVPEFNEGFNGRMPRYL
jgi:hypothetical protein